MAKRTPRPDLQTRHREGTKALPGGDHLYVRRSWIWSRENGWRLSGIIMTFDHKSRLTRIAETVVRGGPEGRAFLRAAFRKLRGFLVFQQAKAWAL